LSDSILMLFAVFLCPFLVRGMFLYVIPLVRPSFPTRRSSDLAAALPLRHDDRAGRHPLRGRGDPPRGLGLPDRTGQGEARHRPEDRKSTRLNSSHVKISYAVFCLKKKKYLMEVT